MDTIVSTYAFHHLTDDEKARAFKKYYHLLNKEGAIVIADTAFIDEKTKEHSIKLALEQKYDRLAKDLMTEYYTTLPALRKMATQAGFSVSFHQLNPFVWLIHALKEKEG